MPRPACDGQSRPPLHVSGTSERPLHLLRGVRSVILGAEAFGFHSMCRARPLPVCQPPGRSAMATDSIMW